MRYEIRKLSDLRDFIDELDYEDRLSFHINDPTEITKNRTITVCFRIEKNKLVLHEQIVITEE